MKKPITLEDINNTSKDKSVELLGFTGIIQEQKDTNEILEVIASKDDSKVLKKLEEVKSSNLITNKLLKEIRDKEEKEYPKIPEPLEEVKVKNFPELQKVEVTNFPNFPEQKAPVVNIEAQKAPVINVEAPIVNIDNKGVEKEIAKLTDVLTLDTIDKVSIVDEEGMLIDFKKLFKALGDKILSRGGGNEIGTGWTVGQGGGLSPQDSGYLANGGRKFATKIDDVSTTSVTYIGKALVGTSGAVPSWQIQKVDESGTPVTAVTTWANGNDSFINIWDDRLTLTYS